jgi:hypothetical protein
VLPIDEALGEVREADVEKKRNMLCRKDIILKDRDASG